MKNSADKSRWLAGLYRATQRFTRHRFRPFRINASVKDQSFVRLGPQRIECVEEKRVLSLARTLEATIVMSEMLEGEQPLTIETTNLELAHFVAYVRQLDELYRRQQDKLVRLERDNQELLKQRGVTTE